MALSAGTRLGPYEVLAPLGAGGMGEVYRAHDTRLGRDVAIKVLPASFAADSERLRRFEQEARATGMLNHPNILALYDVGTFEQSPYLVTELLEGQTLREELPLPRRKALNYARQIADGLAAAHAKGVTHRDLKPDNIFITKDGRAKILDFGLAKVEAEARDAEATQTVITTPGMVMGTVGYTSPEQARGHLADHRSDIFSFGVMLYEMLSGQRAFERDTAVETLNAIIKDDPPPLEDAALDRVVRRCMEKSPDQRFLSASDLAFAIEALEPISAAIVCSRPSGAAHCQARPVPGNEAGRDPRFTLEGN
jgi:serine/threonine protein kinase